MESELITILEGVGTLGTVGILVWLLLREMQRSDTRVEDSREEVDAYREFILKQAEAFEQRISRQDERNHQFNMRMIEYYVHLVDRTVLDEPQTDSKPTTRTVLRPNLTPDEIDEYFKPGQPPGGD